MKFAVPAFAFLFLITSCKSGKSDAPDGAGFFPVRAYLQSQARHVDTSVYSIMKVVRTGTKADTSYLRREDFSAAARAFLTLPDVATPGLQKQYTETRLYDEDLKKVVLSYMPKNSATAPEIIRQDVIIEPGDGTADSVQIIYIETLVSDKDSTVQKRMTWDIDKGFQIIKLATAANGAEQIETTEVSWHE